MMAKFKVGERVKFINNGGYVLHDNQQAGKIIAKSSSDMYEVKVDNYRMELSFSADELIPETSKPSKSERISLLESQVADLTAKVEALQNRRRPAVALTKSPNQQRKAVIERAKAFVAGFDIPKSQRLNFYVNAEKRTVVAVITWARTGFVKQREYAKCAPDDVFNADIGKAIALGRALGLDVSEFENAVKPTEVVVGQKVIYGVHKERGVLTVINDGGGGDYLPHETKICIAKTLTTDILDDTEAQY